MEIDKKGQMETVGILAFIFMFILIVGIVYYIFNLLGNIDIFSSNPTAATVIQGGKDLYGGMDFALPGILFALNIGSLISLFFLRSNPVLSIVLFVMMPITILIAAIVSNSYELAESALGMAANFPIAHFFMSKLPIVMFVFDVIGGIFLFVIDR